MSLKVYGYTSTISCKLTKRNNLYYFLYASLDKEPFIKCGLLLRTLYIMAELLHLEVYPNTLNICWDSVDTQCWIIVDGTSYVNITLFLRFLLAWKHGSYWTLYRWSNRITVCSHLICLHIYVCLYNSYPSWHKL